MAKKFITLQKRIKHLLQSDEILKDSDFKLIAQVWYQDLQKMGLEPKSISGYQLLEIISHHKLSNPHSIIRHRRRVQVENAELRGLKYTAKKENQKTI